MMALESVTRKSKGFAHVKNERRVIKFSRF